MDVNVIPVPEPVVHISGTSDISREYEDFKLGVRIFADIHIVMTTGSPTGSGKSFFLIFTRPRKKLHVYAWYDLGVPPINLGHLGHPHPTKTWQKATLPSVEMR